MSFMFRDRFEGELIKTQYAAVEIWWLIVITIIKGNNTLLNIIVVNFLELFYSSQLKIIILQKNNEQELKPEYLPIFHF